MTILKRGKPRDDDRVHELREELKHGSKYVKYSMNIPRKLHAEFRRKALLSDIDMKDVLMEAIRKYMLT